MPERSRAFLLALAFCLALLPAVADAQTVRGRILEDETRSPIHGTLIELLATDGSSAGRGESDSDGHFSVRATSAGLFTIRLSHPFFSALDTDVIPLGPGEVLAIELRMGRRVIPLEPLVVTARRHARLGGFYDRLREPGFGRFITRAEIESRPSTNRTTDLLRGMPGVEIVPVRIRGGITGNVILMRSGAGRCEPTIMLDGSPVRQIPGSGIDDFLKPDMLEGVEIYARGASAPQQLMVASNSCGVIAFWTRTGSAEGGQVTLKRILAAGAILAGLITFILLGHS